MGRAYGKMSTRNRTDRRLRVVERLFAGFRTRNISLAVIVIDFYTWTQFGDFQFDLKCWPNISKVAGMLGDVKILRSTYPWVNKASIHYQEAITKDVLAHNTQVLSSRGASQCPAVAPYTPLFLCLAGRGYDDAPFLPWSE